MLYPLFLLIAGLHTIPPLADYHREWNGYANGLYWKSDVYTAIPYWQLENLKMKYIATVYRSQSPRFDKSFAHAIACANPDLYALGMRFAISGEYGQFGGRSSYCFPLADLPLLEDTGLGRELFDLKYNPKREPSNQCGPFKTDGRDLIFPKHRPWDLPEDTMHQRLLDYGRIFWVDKHTQTVDLKTAYMNLVQFDTLPIDALTLRLFAVLDGRLSVSVEAVPYQWPEHSIAIGRKPPPIPDRNLKTGNLPASFLGRFQAYAVGDIYYLLTAGGKLYKCGFKGKDGLDISEIWSDPAHPLIGVVDVPETKQVFGFGWGTKPKNNDRYWIEFVEKPAPTAYNFKQKLRNDREDAFREVTDCVRALKAMKAIKPIPAILPAVEQR